MGLVGDSQDPPTETDLHLARQRAIPECLGNLLRCRAAVWRLCRRPWCWGHGGRGHGHWSGALGALLSLVPDLLVP